MSTVSVQVNLGALSKFMNRTVQSYLRKKAEEIADEARRTAPVGATGDLANSILVTTGAKGSVKIEVGAPYAGYVIHGTGPQATPPRPPYFPKLRRRGLILWSESKSLDPYAVAHGISQKGTPPNPFFEEAVKKVLSGFNFVWINDPRTIE